MRVRLTWELLVASALVAFHAAGADAQSRPDSAPSRVTKDASADAATRGRRPLNVTGLYRALQINRGGSCAPRQLPRPIPSAPADTLGYFPTPTPVADSVPFWVRVTQTASAMSWTPSQDSLGTTSMPSVTGTIRPDGSFTNGRVVPMGLEAGPREGGVRLFGTQDGRAQGRFEDAGGMMRLSGSGTLTFRFNEGSENGAVYTTCTVPFTMSATRVTP
jgi:hypothetical protein